MFDVDDLAPNGHRAPFFGRIAEAIARRRRSWAEARRCRALLGLSDDQLRDIGLDRYRVQAGARCGRGV